MANSMALKLEKQSCALGKKIDGLSGNYLTNTWKRQQEQRHRDEMLSRYRAQQQVYDYLTEETTHRELSPIEKAITVGAFYEDMRSLLARKKYVDEGEGRQMPAIPSTDTTMGARLKKAGIQSQQDMLAAISAFADLVQKATIPPDPKAARLRDLIYKARLYQEGDVQFTPDGIARQVVDLANLQADSKVLEPEAGIAYLADEVAKTTPHVDCAEISPTFREVLKIKGHNLIGDDFLKITPVEDYDAVVMNPPFSEECAHICHAYQFLKPGGVLVSVCCTRIQNSTQKRYLVFQEWLQQMPHSFEQPVDSKFEMTGTACIILVLHKE